MWREQQHPRYNWSGMRPLASCPGVATPPFVLSKNSHRGTIEIVVLAALQRPQEAGQAGSSQEQGDGDEESEHRHCAGTGLRLFLAGGVSVFVFPMRRPKRRALPMTIIEEPDIAIAAISGVTYPRIAIGTAIAL